MPGSAVINLTTFASVVQFLPVTKKNPLDSHERPGPERFDRAADSNARGRQLALRNGDWTPRPVGDTESPVAKLRQHLQRKREVIEAAKATSNRALSDVSPVRPRAADSVATLVLSTTTEPTTTSSTKHHYDPNTDDNTFYRNMGYAVAAGTVLIVAGCCCSCCMRARAGGRPPGAPEAAAGNEFEMGPVGHAQAAQEPAPVFADHGV